MNNNLIYGLVDPRNDVVYYVGKTTVGMSRPISHLNYSHNKYVRKWVDELRLLELSPIIMIIEDNLPLQFLSSREIYWISEYYQINTNLFNIDLEKDAILKYDFNVSEQEIDVLIKLLSNLPKLIKSVRHYSNQTQQEISDLVNINRSTLIQMEGTGDGKISTLVKLLKIVKSKGRMKKKKKVRLFNNEKQYYESQANFNK
jgi:DNA-binding XRE family transcriptional regulator